MRDGACLALPSAAESGEICIRHIELLGSGSGWVWLGFIACVHPCAVLQVPVELIQLQVAVHQKGAMGKAGGEWSSAWEVRGGRY